MASSSENSDKLREFESLRDLDYQESEMVRNSMASYTLQSILDGVLDRVCRNFSGTEYSVGKEQSVLLQTSDERIKAQRDLYQEQRITANPGKGQSAIPPFRFANYDTQKLKIQKVKVMIGSEIVHYSLTFSTRRATCAEVASMVTQRSLQDHSKITPKPLYKAPEKTVPDPMIRASPDCNIPGTATFPEPEFSNEMENDPSQKAGEGYCVVANHRKNRKRKRRRRKLDF